MPADSDPDGLDELLASAHAQLAERDIQLEGLIAGTDEAMRRIRELESNLQLAQRAVEVEEQHIRDLEAVIYDIFQRSSVRFLRWMSAFLRTVSDSLSRRGRDRTTRAGTERDFPLERSFSPGNQAGEISVPLDARPAQGNALVNPAPELDIFVPAIEGRTLAALLDARSQQVFDLLRQNAELRTMYRQSEVSANTLPLDSLARSRWKAFRGSPVDLQFDVPETPLVSVIVTPASQIHNLYLALEHLARSAPDVPFDLTIVNSDESPEFAGLMDHVRGAVIQPDGGGTLDARRDPGGTAARGEYVCLLNGDAVVSSGWLSALMRAARAWPDCGAVGAKIIWPSMRLGEAGGIVETDGSLQAYGRDSQPFDPEFCYVREVDFCSADCLLIESALFRDVGGLEDRVESGASVGPDLCSKIRGLGRSVIFSPHAVVYRQTFDAADPENTSGSHPGLARTRIDPLSADLAQWRLSTFRSRDRRPGKRVLVIDDATPDPRLGSGFPRSRALVQALVASGYVLTLLPTRDVTAHQPVTAELQEQGVEVLFGYHDVDATLAARAGLYDIVIVSRPHNAVFTESIRAHHPRATLVYDAEAIYALRTSVEEELRGTPQSPGNIEVLVSEETQVATLADVVLATTAHDAAIIRRHHSTARVLVWGHAISIRPNDTPFDDRRDLCFAGYLGSSPNEDAILYFLREIFPRVHRELSCKFVLAGAGASPELLNAISRSRGRVNVPTQIDDLSPLYAASRVFVAPHRYGAGLPLKVIDAMANGLPCVVSRVLADQLEVAHGGAAMVASTAAEFAAQVATLYNDEVLWNQVKDSAFQLVRDRYDPERMRRLLVEELESVSSIRIS